MDENAIKASYQNMSADELMKEFNAIVSIPNARTNVEALTKMSILMEICEAKGIALPGGSGSSTASVNYTEEESSFSVGTLILGIVLLLVGIGLTMSGSGIYYGAIIVGFIMIFKAFM